MPARKTLAEAPLKLAWSDEVIVRASTALAQLMADAVLQTIAVHLARHDSR
jgi:hypothetical protein